MANSGSFTTSSADGKNLIYSWELQSQSIANNSSVIKWTLTGGGTSSGYTMAGNFKVTTNGNTVYSSASRIELRVGTVVASGTITIQHDSNGTKTFSAYAEAGIYTYAVNCTGTGSWSLPTIPRYATITSAPNFNDEGNPVLKYSNLAGNNATSLEACISSNGTTATISYRALTKTGTSYTFNLTTAERNTLRNLIPNAQSKTVTFIVKTVIGGNTFYDKKEVTFSITNANPTFTDVTYEDVNAVSVGITGDNQKIVQNKSSLTVRFSSATANKGATISSYSFTLNGVVKSSASVGDVSFGAVNSAENLTLVAKAIDSRGFSTTVNVPVTMLAYSNPTAIITLGRVNNYEDDTRLKVDGAVSSLDGHNTMVIKYRKKQSGGAYGSFTTISDDTEVSTTCDKNYQFTFNVVVTDAFGTAYNVELELPKGKFPLFIDTVKNAIGINEFADDGEALRVSGGIAHFEGGIQLGDYPFDIIDSLTSTETHKGLSANQGRVIKGLIDGIPSPTDYIEAQGTSGIWTYVKLHGGICACWGKATFTISSWSAWGSIYESSQYFQQAYPSGLFNATPYFWVGLNSNANTTASLVGFEVWSGGSNANTPRVYGIRPSTVATANYPLNMLAIGRWK